MENVAERVIAKFAGPDGRKSDGVKAIAGILNLKEVQVYKFTYSKEKGGTGGVIPHHHAQKLLREAPDIVVPADFFDRPAEAAQ